MPCFTKYTTTVEWNTKNEKYLLQYFESLGLAVSRTGSRIRAAGQFEDNYIICDVEIGEKSSKLEVTAQGSEKFSQNYADSIRQGYSQWAVRKAAKKHGWKVQTSKNQNQYMLSKRSY